jgi:hypothetical protein
MVTVFLTTFLSCSQVLGIANKLQSIMGLTHQQKIEITSELRKVIPSCPIIIKNDDRRTETRN